MSDWRAIWNQAINAKGQFIHSNNFSLFEYLLKKYPNDGMVYYVLGDAYECKNEKDKALEAYKTAYYLFPMPRWKQRAQDGIDRIEGNHHQIQIQTIPSDNVFINSVVDDQKCNKIERLYDSDGNEIIF